MRSELRRERGFIEMHSQKPTSSVGAAWRRTCRPDGALRICAAGSYKQTAPTELPNRDGLAAHRPLLTRGLSLTPRFSGVNGERWWTRTVLTVLVRVSGEPKTVKTVESSVRTANTPLKRGVNETLAPS